MLSCDLLYSLEPNLQSLVCGGAGGAGGGPARSAVVSHPVAVVVTDFPPNKMMPECCLGCDKSTFGSESKLEEFLIAPPPAKTNIQCLGATWTLRNPWFAQKLAEQAEGGLGS
ncbi:unnamed protein product [Sphacelaria rigidula]